MIKLPLLKTSSPLKNKIIWAVDPTQNPMAAKNIVLELKFWSDILDCDIQPLSILSKSSFNFPSEIKLPSDNQFEVLAHKIINGYLNKIRIQRLLPAQIVFVPAMSKRKMAVELAKYADDQRPLIIFANTQARKTWNPYRLGGFAERLIATSKVPVLLLNPQSLPSSKISTTIFPTDFSPKSKMALDILTPWAKAFESKILLYNQIEAPYVYSGSFKGAWGSPELAVIANMKNIEVERNKKGQAWARNLLLKEGINCVVQVQRQQKQLSEQIVQIAKKNKAGLIAIASYSDPVDQFVLGSVAQNVLLQATCPVLVFPSRAHGSSRVLESYSNIN